MHMSSLEDLFVEELRDLLHAENQLIKALPKMAKSASAPELRSAFEEHLEQTKGHADQVEQVLEKLGKSTRGKRCKAMEGIIEEGKDLMQNDAEPEVMDAGLIAAAQKVEHYEIAGYGTVRTFAKMLGDNDSARVLQQILDEEERTDRKLTELAERKVNKEAMQ